MTSGVACGGCNGPTVRIAPDSLSSDADDSRSNDHNVVENNERQPLKNNEIGGGGGGSSALRQTNCDKNLYTFSSNAGHQLLKQDMLSVTGKPYVYI